MTLQVIVPLLVAAVLVFYLGIALRTWIRFRGSRIVICPDNALPASVVVDAGHAAATAVRETADVKLTACSRWPAKAGCDQACTVQIQAAPNQTWPRTMAVQFFKGKRCGICAREIDPPAPSTLPAGFMHPVSHQVQAWDEIEPALLPEAMALWKPLCPRCTLTESFAQRVPHRVVQGRPD
jgi:hypothetical protein